MPSMIPVVLSNNGTDTTFSPRNVDATSGVGTYVSSTGVPLGDVRLQLGRSRTAASGKEKVSVKLTVPIVANQTVNGVSTPVVARTSYFEGTFTFDKASNTEERAGVRRWLQDLFGEAQLAQLTDNLDYLY